MSPDTYRARMRHVHRTQSRRVVLALSGCAVAMLGIVPVAHAETPPPAGELAFTITDQRVTESSGLARDTDNNVFWTINDSGDRGVVYAIGPDGRTRGTVEFDADPVDVEAIAYANGRLYVADIGDNQAQRESVRIYVINAPTPGVDRGSSFTTYEFTYPDGPHDAEAILVEESGRIRIVTKAPTGGIYLAPEQLTTGGRNELTRVADAPAWVTDATVLPSGQFAVRTYLSLEVLDPESHASVARARLPFQPQGESLTVSMTDQVLLIGSEGAQSRVLRVPIPAALDEVPPAGESPPPSPLPPPPEDTGSVLDSVGVNRSGTYTALALAFLVAIVSAVVVFVRGKGAEQPVAAPARRSWDTPADDGPAGDVQRTPFPDAGLPPDTPPDDEPTQLRPAIKP